MTDILRDGGDWRLLTGTVYRLQQPALTGRIECAAVAHAEVATVEAQLAPLLAEPLPPAPAGASAALRLVQLVGFACGALQRSCLIAASEEFHVHAAARGFEVALPVADPRAAQAAFDWTLRTVDQLAAGRLDAQALEAAVRSARAALRPFGERLAGRFALARSAQRLRIPILGSSDEFLVLGTGRHSRWLTGGMTDRTSSIGASIARSRSRTAAVLRQAGFPAARSALVRSRGEALTAARRLGFPVVVKADDGDPVEEIPRLLRDDEAVGSAFDAGARPNRPLLVERAPPASACRFHVIDGEFVGVTVHAAGRNAGTPAATQVAVHSDNVRLALDVALLLRLDAAAIDLASEDLARSWRQVRAQVTGISLQPQLPGAHALDPIVRAMVGGGEGRIPAELFVWPAGAARAARMDRFAAGAAFDGVSDAGGLRVQGARCTAPFPNDLAAGQALLAHTGVNQAACVMSPRDIVQFGLPLDRWAAVHFDEDAAFAAGERAALDTARRYLGP